MGWPGRVLGGAPPSSVAAPGVFSVGEVFRAMRACEWPTVQDPYFASVSMLCHFQGPTGKEVFLNNGTGTPLSNNVVANRLVLSDAQAKFGPTPGATSLLGNSNGTLRTGGAGEASYGFGTGDWTVEFWIYPTSIANSPDIFDMRPNGSNGPMVYIYCNSSGSIRLYVDWADRITSANGALVINAWQHVACARVSGTTRLFVDGVQVGSDYTDGNTYANGAVCCLSGGGGTGRCAGYMDEVRITKGVGRYSSNFTPPTAAFPDY
jgi:hypothetical protein